MNYMYTCIHVPLIYIFYSIAIYRSSCALFGAALRYDVTYGDWERRNERKRKRESNCQGFSFSKCFCLRSFSCPDWLIKYIVVVGLYIYIYIYMNLFKYNNCNATLEQKQPAPQS